MNQLSELKQLSVNELFVKMVSFLKREFEITDGQSSYVEFDGVNSVISAARNNWAFQRHALQGERYIRILISKNSKQIGYFTFDNKDLVLKLNSGFEAKMVTSTYWSTKRYTWQTATNDNILTIKESMFSLKTPFKVLLNASLDKTSEEAELMLLYGVAYSLDARYPNIKLPMGYFDTI